MVTYRAYYVMAATLSAASVALLIAAVVIPPWQIIQYVIHIVFYRANMNNPPFVGDGPCSTQS